jgi:hypothetical protein
MPVDLVIVYHLTLARSEDEFAYAKGPRLKSSPLPIRSCIENPVFDEVLVVGICLSLICRLIWQMKGSLFEDSGTEFSTRRQGFCGVVVGVRG